MSDDVLVFESYPLRSTEKLRYADTDRLGHINNTVFAMLFESGRAELLYGERGPKLEPSHAFVMTRFVIDLVGETRWPGLVELGTRVNSIGRSSVELEQAMFQDRRCVATAKTVVELFDKVTRRSCALPPAAVQYFSLFEVRRADAPSS